MLDLLDVLDLPDMLGLLEVLDLLKVLDLPEMPDLLEVTGLLEVLDLLEVVGLLEVLGLPELLDFLEDVFCGVLCLYQTLFYYLEVQGVVDPLNEIDLLALHTVFLPCVNRHLDIWKGGNGTIIA